MKLQHYFTLLVLATVITLIGAAEWTYSKKSATENREAFYSGLSSQASSFEEAVESKIESLRYQLAQAASRHTDSSSSLTSESSFSAIAWLQKNPEGAAAKYKAIWAEANTQTFDPTWLKGLNFSQIKDGETLFVRRVDRNGNAFFALVMTALTQSSQSASALPEQTSSADERIYLFAAIAPTTLSAWVDEWVGSSRAALVFDEHGNVVSHSQRQYSGTNLSKDKLVSSSIRSGRAKLTTEFSDLESEARIGESLRIGRTNLRAAISAPKAALLKPLENNSNPQRGLMISIGMFLVAITYFVSGRLGGKLAKNPVAATQETKVETFVEPIVDVVAQAEPDLTFDDVEQKTRLNIEEILSRSAEIRQKLQADFIETVESEQKIFFEELATIEAKQPDFATEMPIEVNTPKVKVRRPKVSL